MKIEQELDRQRLRLLRLLAGLAALVVLVSLAPALSMVPQWVRAHMASVLVRAELAAENMVIVAAYVMTRTQVSVAPVPSVWSQELCDGRLSTVRLLRRIATLRAVLENLPRAAQRLLKRLEKARRKSREDTPVHGWDWGAAIASSQSAVFDAREDRPPDKRHPARRLASRV